MINKRNNQCKMITDSVLTANLVGAIHESPLPMTEPPPDTLERHHRRSIRLHGYDYSQAGAFFLTFCTQNRECLFGDVVDGKMQLNDAGKIVADEWLKIAEIRDDIELDEWIVMPNHFHGILTINNTVGAIHESPLQMTITQRRNMTLPKLIGRFKMLSSKRINEMRDTPGIKLWQRNYYEHIIRKDDSLCRIREYILNNPLQWEMDRENPAAGAIPVSTLPKDEPWRI
jgi:REP element-mobilizing transposase RayT